MFWVCIKLWQQIPGHYPVGDEEHGRRPAFAERDYLWLCRHMESLSFSHLPVLWFVKNGRTYSGQLALVWLPYQSLISQDKCLA